MRDIIKKNWMLVCVGLVLFFSVSRYYGFYEDAGRYLLQVVNYLHPERFVDDVPFMFGNQDSYSLFSPFMALIFKVLGVNGGAFGMMFVFQLSWCLGLIYLVNRWCDRFARELWSLSVFAICVTTLAFKLYGCGSYFPIIDGILVARFVAEIFMLFAFAGFFYKARYLSLGLFCVGSLFHPLMAGWGLPLWLFYHYPKSRYPVLLGALLFPLTAFLHVGAFDFLPDDWLYRPICFAPNFYDILFHIALLTFWLAMGKCLKNTQVARFAKCVFWVCLVGLFFHYVGIYMEHVFLIQVQPYRVQWFCIILVFPVLAIFCHEQLSQTSVPEALRKIQISPKWAKIAIVFCLIVLLVIAAMSNYIQLVLEQGTGDVGFATSFIDLPSKLIPLQKAALSLLLVVSLLQRRFLFSLLFAYSLVNGFVSFLPIFAGIFYLELTMGKMLKRLLLALAVALTFAEMLTALPGSPMQGNALGNIAFLGCLFVSVMWFLWLRDNGKQKRMIVPLVFAFVCLAVWDFCTWDARSEEMRDDERQMDAFFEEPIFPQVSERGKMLFVENGEIPLQSRFKFLTGTYADETINVGEIFFEGQFKEARRRKNMLLNGASVLRDMGDYRKRVQELYRDSKILANRAEFLCRAGEISHFATDYTGMPLVKQDSAYLDVKKKYVYLYGCPSR